MCGRYRHGGGGDARASAGSYLSLRFGFGAYVFALHLRWLPCHHQYPPLPRGLACVVVAEPYLPQCRYRYLRPPLCR